MKIKQVCSALYFALFPKKCIACGRVIDRRLNYCEDCRDTMPVIAPQRCLLCGAAEKECRCEHKKRAFDGIAAPFYYEGGAKHALLKLKRYPVYAEALAEPCAECVHTYFAQQTFDFVTCVPMDIKRLKESGFNHSAALAKQIAARLQIPFRECLSKLYAAKPQHGLSYTLRIGNVKGVFDVCDEACVQGKCILLVDDIKTSGATLDECAGMLKLYGAKSVFAVVVALRPEKQEGRE